MRGFDMVVLAKLLLLVAVCAVCGAGSALAVTSSQNYEAVETEFGAGSALETCSGQYCARATIGDISGGESSSKNHTAEFSQVTADSEPFIEVIIEPGQSNLGVLELTKTATKETIVKIRSHLSDGYTLQVVGEPPTYGDHALNTSSTLMASTPGTEQFGINLVKNTVPGIGADLVQTPSEQTSFGEVAEGYSVPNMFKYVNGDVVALSRSQSGQTDYTISMIVNVAGSTPAGHYAADFSVLVVPIF